MRDVANAVTGYRHRRALPALCICAAVLGGPTEAIPAAPVTARDLSLGGTGAATVTGVNAIWSNPANLAARDRPAFSLMFLSAALGASNNSFSLDQYNRFTRPGTELTLREKSEILSSIPEDHFQIRAEAAGNILGFTMGPVGIAATPRVFGSLTLAKDYFDLLFTGNELHHTYSFDGTSGESIAFLETALSYGRRTSWLPFANGRWGVSFKILTGAAYFEVLESQGHLVTYPSKASGRAGVKVQFSGETEKVEKDGESDWEYTPTVGHGFGFDLGIAGDLSRKWKTAVVLRDIGSTISWDRGTEKSYSYSVDSLTVANADEEDLIVDEESDTPVDGFDVPLPTMLHVEFTRETRRCLFTTAYDQGFRSFAGVSTSPKLTLGTEVRWPAWIPLRTSVSFGGGMGTCLAGGFGLHLGALRFDAAALTRSFSPGNAKGGLLALTTYMRF